MARKAVAATLASILIFTALVVADSTIVAAGENAAAMSQASHVESRESLLAEYSAGAAAIGALAQVQAYLQSNAANCSGIAPYLGSVSADSWVSGKDEGITYSSHATLPAATPAPLAQGDDGSSLLLLVAPFSGHRAGALNLQANVDTTEDGGGGLVSLERHDVLLLNLPISPESASSLCGSTLASLREALSRSPCNASLEQAAFESAMPSLVEQAGLRGFFLTAGWSLAGGPGCPASYWIMLAQLGVQGLTGKFDWVVRGYGAVS